MRGWRRVRAATVAATVAQTPKPQERASCGGEEVWMWRKAAGHSRGAGVLRVRRCANGVHGCAGGEKKTQLRAAVRGTHPNHR